MAQQSKPHFLEVGRGPNRRRIACLCRPRKEGAPPAPGLMWLQGFKSEMVSVKATALDEWAQNNGLALTRFDYSGHGQSEGRFEDGTLGRWVEEARAVFETLTSGPQILIGSSMGGAIALLLLRRLMVEHPAAAARITGLVLIAPAWDMTEELMWKRFPEPVRHEITERGVWLRPSHYGDPYAITRSLIEDGRRHLLARRPWNPGRPVLILHGRLDPDVPFAHSEALAGFLQGDHVRITEVPDGEHRLSRPEDLELLFGLIDELRR